MTTIESILFLLLAINAVTGLAFVYDMVNTRTENRRHFKNYQDSIGTLLRKLALTEEMNKKNDEVIIGQDKVIDAHKDVNLKQKSYIEHLEAQNKRMHTILNTAATVVATNAPEASDGRH